MGLVQQILRIRIHTGFLQDGPLVTALWDASEPGVIGWR